MTDLIWGSIIGFIFGVVLTRLISSSRPPFIVHPKKLTPSHVTLKKPLPENTLVWVKDHFEYRPAIIVGFSEDALHHWNGAYYNVKFVSGSDVVFLSSTPALGDPWVPSSYVFEPTEMVKTRFESYLNYFDKAK